MEKPCIVGLHASPDHSFSKACTGELRFIEGIGIEGDAHAGETVQHLSRIRKDPSQPNLRQVHLIGEELIESLRHDGFKVSPGSMGENVTTRGIDLINLPRETRLKLGAEVIVNIKGLRNPCAQLDNYQQGLLAAVVEKTPSGDLIRKAGVMAVVETSGVVRTGDEIVIEYPADRVPLEVV